MNALMISSHVSSNSLEQIAEVGNPNRWFQIYFPEDRGYASEIIHRAKAAGYTAIVATVDDQVAFPREQNMRAAQIASTQPRPAAPRGAMGPGNASLTIADPRAAARARAKKVNVTFDDLVWIKKEVGLPVIVKGIVSPKIAQSVIAHGLDAVYVSNHGGRALDTVPGTFTALPRVADAVKGRVPVIFDGGVRRGTDVFKALASGADLVGCGRPIFYGLALGGSLGVQSVLEYLKENLTLTMQLAGTPNVKAITRDYLTRRA
jgi:lactate oxidase